MFGYALVLNVQIKMLFYEFKLVILLLAKLSILISKEYIVINCAQKKKKYKYAIQ